MNDNADKNSIWGKLSNWLMTPLGQMVLHAERVQLDDALPNLFGYHILQFGHAANTNFMAASRITNKTFLLLDDAECQPGEMAIRTQSEELPVAADSIDVIVLPHILEYSKNPHKLLREMDRVLIGDGHVVIIGINPFSLWGIWHLFLCWWNEMPWSGRLISIRHLKDWLSLLDFEVETTRNFFFSPPIQNQTLLDKLRPLERLGSYCWPIFSGLYVLVAKKRVVPLNPVKMQWSGKRQLLGAGMVEPTTRNSAGSHG